MQEEMASKEKAGSRWSRSVQFIKTDAMDMFFAIAILLNSIVLGVDIEVSLRRGGDSGTIVFWISFGFIVLFVIELLWRVLADGCRFFCTVWGIFDTAIILTSIVEYGSFFIWGSESPIGAVSVMRILRLLRIARIVRILHICPELSMLISGLAASMKAVFWVFSFLLVFMYICALICTMELGTSKDDEMRQYFGSVGSSFYTHFMVLTLEGYPDIVKAAGRLSWFWYFYFVTFIIFSSVVLMNVVTGIVCESVVSTARNEELESHVYEEESRKFQEVLTEFLISEGFSLHDEITFEQFQCIIQKKGVREALNTLEICLEVDDKTLFQILDEDGNTKLSFDELFSSLLRLRGSKHTLHSLLVQDDLIRGGQQIMHQLCDLENDLQIGSKTLCNTVRERFESRVSEAIRQCRKPTGRRRECPESQRKRRHRPKMLDENVDQSDAAMARQFLDDPIHSSEPPADLQEQGAVMDAIPNEARMRSGSAAIAENMEAAQMKQAMTSESSQQQRVLRMIEVAERTNTEAKAVLRKLREDFAASQSRVRELEERLQNKLAAMDKTLLIPSQPRREGVVVEAQDADHPAFPAPKANPVEKDSEHVDDPSTTLSTLLPPTPSGAAAGPPARQRARMEMRRRLEARLAQATGVTVERAQPPEDFQQKARSPRPQGSWSLPAPAIGDQRVFRTAARAAISGKSSDSEGIVQAVP